MTLEVGSPGEGTVTSRTSWEVEVGGGYKGGCNRWHSGHGRDRSENMVGWSWGDIGKVSTGGEGAEVDEIRLGPVRVEMAGNMLLQILVVGKFGLASRVEAGVAKGWRLRSLP